MNLLHLMNNIIHQNKDILWNDDALLTEIKTHKTVNLSWYRTIHREPYTSEQLQLKPELTNFSSVQRGESLHADGTPPLLAPNTGRILFPKYPRRGVDGAICETLPKEIYRIIQEI